MIEQTVRLSPRVSLTKLAEYIVAPPARRRTIIIDQREPKSYIVPLYTEANAAVARFLLTRNPVELVNAIKHLDRGTCTTKWELNKRNSQKEAIGLAQAFVGLNLDGVTCSLGSNDAPKMKINGVEVSVRPEVLLTWQDGKGRDRSGAIKLYFSKNHPLDEEAGAYAATLLRRYVQDSMEDRLADGQRCFVLDVFAQRYFVSPVSWRRRMKDIIAACLEIVLGWKY